MTATVHDTLESLAATLAANKALIALDIGEKTIGIAVSDTRRSIASALQTIRRSKFTPDAQQLLKLCLSRQIGGIILGLPLNMDGSEGPRCQSTRAFARNLAPLTEIPIAFQDERLSTVAAERTLLHADASRKKRAMVIDHVAASYILQAALDRLAYLERHNAQ